MQRTGSLVGLALILLMAGCKDSDKEKQQVEEGIVGNWQATKCVYASTEGLGTVDVITLGGTATLVLGEDKSFVYTYQPPIGLPNVINATYEITGDIGDLMKITPVGVPWYWAMDVDLNGNTLKLSNGGAEYDFNHDGYGESAKWSLTLMRIR